DASFFGLDYIILKPLQDPDGSPVITAQPPSQTVLVAGATAAIKVGAAGRLPLSYQWRLNGATLPGATNATLTLPGVAASQTGNYSALVSNVFGVATSSDAGLTVLGGNLALGTFDDLSTSFFAIPSGYSSLD